MDSPFPLLVEDVCNIGGKVRNHFQIKKEDKMKKWIPVLLVLVLASGCAFKSATSVRTEAGYFELEALPTNAKYEIAGEAEGTVSGGVCVGCIPIGIPNNAGIFYSATPSRGCSIPGLDALSVDIKADQAAVYNALENAGEADFLVAPRFKRDGTNYLYLYRSINVTVRGKAAKIVYPAD